MVNGQSFDEAKLAPIAFPSGKAVVKKVRCGVAAGRGHLTQENAMDLRQLDYHSKHNYKQYAYAQNSDNVLCIYYEGKINGKTERAFKIAGLPDLAKLKIKRPEEIIEEPYYKRAEVGRGKNKSELSFSCILKPGTKCIFYNENIEELKSLEQSKIFNRVFRVYKFNEMGTPNIHLQNHVEARPDLDDGDTLFSPDRYQYRLKLKADKFTCAIEGKHFKIMPDGEVIWLF